MAHTLAPSHKFSSVTASLPAKIRGSEAEEEWQEVDWVTWSAGELNVDRESLLLVFKPESKSGVVQAKPLGVLVRASVVTPNQDGRTLAIVTSDSLQNRYRLTFASASDCQTFSVLAKIAEERGASTVEPASNAGTAPAVQAALLEAAIKGGFPGTFPLVQCGVELYGPDPRNSEGAEVLLGRGAAVLLDPVGTKIGTYELLFIDEEEGVKRPITLDMGPNMQLRAQTPEEQDEDGPAAMLVFTSANGPPHTLAFDTALSAGDFERDLRLRMRCLRLLTAPGSQRASTRPAGLSFGFVRQLALLLILVAALVRLALLVRASPGRPPRLYLEDLVADAHGIASSLQGLFASAGSSACAVLTGAVPRAELRACTSLDRPAAWRCVESLAGGGA